MRLCQNGHFYLNHGDHREVRSTQRIDNESFKLSDLHEFFVHSVVKLYFDTASYRGGIKNPYLVIYG